MLIPGKMRLLLLKRISVGFLVATVPAVQPSLSYVHTRATEDYKKYRRDMTALRSNFLNEHKQHIKMTTEDFGSQAAQEARIEKEREENALRMNEMELKRMAEIR